MNQPPTIPTDHLECVTRLPREEWGEAFLVLVKCERSFDDGRGVPFGAYFASSWWRYRLDRLRMTTSKRRRPEGRTLVSFDAKIDHPDTSAGPAESASQLEEQAAAVRRCGFLVEQYPGMAPTVNAIGRDHGYRREMLESGRPMGTVKMSRSRIRVYANGGR